MELTKDPLIEKAQAAVAAKLGISADAVDIAVGDKRNDSGVYVASPNSSDDLATNLVFTLTMPGLDLDQKGARAKIRDAFGSLPPIAAIAQMKTEEKLATEVVSKLRAATADTDFNTKLLEWPAFNSEIAKNGWGVDDYALSYLNNNAYGVEFSLHIPTDKKTDPTPLVEQVAGEQKKRVESGEVHAVITERAEKYIRENLRKEGKQDAEIEQAVVKMREDVAKLIISVNVERGREINVSIRSPEQAKAHETAPSAYNEPDNADKLRANNPLQHILTSQLGKDEHPQLHKTLARAFLFTKDEKTNRYTKPIETFPLIAGRHDMKVAIAKELSRVSKERTDKAEEFKQILESPLFKDHERWSQTGADVTLPPPVFEKDPKNPNTIKVWIPINSAEERFKGKNPVAETIQGLAALSTETPAVAPQDAGWAAKFAKDAEAKLGANDPKPASAVERETARQEQPAAGVGAAR